MKVLHISGHLGGGVGAVILNFLTEKKADLAQEHDLVCLDTINQSSKVALEENSIRFYDFQEVETEFNCLLANYDIILLHWWNHPLITNLLVNYDIPPIRLIIWSHISGNKAPNNFTEKIFRFPDKFVFTTPLSYQDQTFNGLCDHEKDKVEVIWSTAGIERVMSYPRNDDDIFRIGYVGNYDPVKFHEKFFESCREINIPNKFFTLVGPAPKHMVTKAASYLGKNQFNLTGYLSEDEKWHQLSQFDIFGYPLEVDHYGTCDQTIQEAMAAGKPPVVLNNPMESYMVEHGKTGIVAKSIQSYVRWIEKLYQHDEMRWDLGKRAQRKARELYSSENLLGKWDSVFEEVFALPKTPKRWAGRKNGKFLPYEVFLESLGHHKGVFTEALDPKFMTKAQAEDQLSSLGRTPNWTSKTKSTVHHYSAFFPKCAILRRWSAVMAND